MPSSTAVAIHMLAPEDVELMEAMSTMFAAAFGDIEAYCGNRPSRSYLKELLGCDYFIALTAVRNGEAVGGLVAYELRKFEQERSEIYIYDLAVDVAHGREGIATALINELKRIAKTRGAYVVFVQADLQDAPAIALYSKLGTREDVLHFDIQVTDLKRH
jgi:aminoglycoside 3-N-acetyltransferase I